MLSPVPLFSLLRGGHEEVCVYGELAVVVGQRLVASWGEPTTRLPARSLLKPFQFLATGRADAPGELDARSTAAFGSISADTEQLATLERWYAGDPLEGELLLPSSLPLDPVARAARFGTRGDRRCHPCFSKHMAILAACRERGWPSAGYTQLAHPYGAALRTLLASLLDRAESSFEFAIDGCQLPTPLLTLSELARLYAGLVTAREGSAAARLQRAMRAHPIWIGGAQRFDTELMRANPGHLIAKEGADGLLAVAFLASGAEAEGGAIVVKLASGHHPEWAVLAAQPFLRARGFDVPSAVPPGQEVVWHARPEQRGRSPLDVSPVLDANIAVWPGDVPFRRAITAQIGTAATTGPAWELTVSSIQTTLHVGAHADAPNHFTADAIGIERVPLTPYRGLCQVIALSKRRGALITPEDLDPEAYPDRRLQAPRVLFRTGSFPDPERFNEDFVAFAAETLRWLEARGVVLVGLDTPSVDPFHSKELPAHHATREAGGMAILEGLTLEHVSAGLYELVALPLKLRDADASPVRAVLWPLR